MGKRQDQCSSLPSSITMIKRVRSRTSPSCGSYLRLMSEARLTRLTRSARSRGPPFCLETFDNNLHGILRRTWRIKTFWMKIGPICNQERECMINPFLSRLRRDKMLLSIYTTILLIVLQHIHRYNCLEETFGYIQDLLKLCSNLICLTYQFIEYHPNVSNTQLSASISSTLHQQNVRHLRRLPRQRRRQNRQH